jgi:hypothetical protein
LRQPANLSLLMVVPSDSCSVADAEMTVFFGQSETLHVQATRVRALRVRV